MPNRIGHGGLTVTDLDRSVAFYRDVLGFTVERLKETKTPSSAIITGLPGSHRRGADISLGGQAIQLTQYVSPQGPVVEPVMNVGGTAHMAIYVDDLAAFFTRARTRGARVKAEPLTSGRGILVGALYDPDGYTIEVAQDTK